MNLLRRFSQSLGFTQAESNVVLFLVFMFVLGIGVRMVRGGGHRARPDYTQEDSVFRARSAAPEPMNMAAGQAQVADSARRTAPTKAAPRVVDINHAPKEALVSLPGIGDAMAERILAYRREHGPFHTIGELCNVKGIGKKKLERLAPYCTLGR